MRTRFAPSPTGPLHLGHAFSALTAWDLARAHGGRFLLRFEDIDRQRSRPEWIDAAEDDLAWLGLAWPRPALRQSTRLPAHRAALERLAAQGFLYPCRCTRRDVEAATSAPQEGTPRHGPDGLVYPGTCRPSRPCGDPLADPSAALRLDMRRAVASLGGRGLTFREEGAGPGGERGLIPVSAEWLVDGVGDVVLARRGMGSSYHLAVVLDDAWQGITHVVRGNDLFEATGIHVLLQALLGLATPVYHHHRLIRDERGRRLAKRDDARALARFRAEGARPQDIRRMLGLPTGCLGA